MIFDTLFNSGKLDNLGDQVPSSDWRHKIHLAAPAFCGRKPPRRGAVGEADREFFLEERILAHAERVGKALAKIEKTRATKARKAAA